MLRDFADAVFSQADVLHLPVLPVEVPTIVESDLATNPRFADYVFKSVRRVLPPSARPSLA